MNKPPVVSPAVISAGGFIISDTKFSKGDVFTVDDDPSSPVVKFPTDNDPTTIRTFHDDRFVLIVQGETPNQDSTLKSVLIVPITSKGRNTDYTIVVPKIYVPTLPQGGVVFVNLIQPILKKLLKHKIGHVPPDCNEFERINAIFFKMVGLL